MNNMLIAQSGGPTAAINASLSGAIQEAIRSKEIVAYTVRSMGFQGVLAGTIVDLRAQFAPARGLLDPGMHPRNGTGILRFRRRKKMRIRRSMKK